MARRTEPDLVQESDYRSSGRVRRWRWLLSRPDRLRHGLRAGGRVQEIVRIMVKYGLSDWLRSLRLDRAFPGVRKLMNRRGRPRIPPDTTRGELLRRAFEELGPTFIKLGQLLSNRSDILPMELVGELSRLQDDVQPLPWSDIEQALRAELGKAPDEIFTEIRHEPSASASMAQVHWARLHDGSEVALKVQRPGIQAIIETDLDIIEYVARWAERHLPISRSLNPTELVREYRKHIMRELDFTRERQNMDRFKLMLGKRNGIHVPRTYSRFSSERLLVMEFVHGTKISALSPTNTTDIAPEFDRKVIARRAADLMLEQILLHGFFHADPHPGNVMVLPGNVICFLDFGLMGSLHEAERDQFVAAIIGVVRRDGSRVTEAVLRLTRCSIMEQDNLVDEIQDLVDEYLDRELRDVNIAQLFTELIGLVVRHGLHVPPNLMMVAKALFTIEGVGMNLCPEFTLESALRGVTKQAVIDRLRPKRMAEAGLLTGLEYLELLRDLPTEISGLSRQVRSGQLTVGFRLRGLEPMRHTLDSIGYRLTFGVVLAALMISSALIIHAKLPPLWNGIPLIGVAGFAIAGVLGLGFLFSLIARVFSRRDY